MARTRPTLTPEERAAMALAREANTVTRTATTTATPESLAAGVAYQGSGITQEQFTSGDYAGAEKTPPIAEPIGKSPEVTLPPSEPFRAWNRTGSEVGGQSGMTFGQSQGKSPVGGMADALRIGTATRAATQARTLTRKKQKNTLGLNINAPGIGLQV